MNSFNYSDLPDIPLMMIAKRLNTKEILNMALRTNEKVLTCLAGLRSTPRNVLFAVVIETAQKTIEFQLEHQRFKLSFAEVLDPSATFTIITTQGAAQLLRTLHNVLGLYAGSVSQMTIDVGVLDEDAVTGLMDIQCQKLTVTGDAQNNLKEALAGALSQVNTTEECSIDSEIEFRIFPAHLPTRKLFLSSVHGVTGTDLVRIVGRTREAELLGSMLTDEDVHMFINAWLRGTDTHTVSLKVFQNRQEVWDKKRLFRGIHYSAYQDGTREKQFVTSRSEAGIPESVENMSLAWDITRADGLMASVLITGTELLFGVWHNRHEIRDKLAECQARQREIEPEISELDRRRVDASVQHMEIHRQFRRQSEQINNRRRMNHGMMNDQEQAQERDRIEAFERSIQISYALMESLSHPLDALKSEQEQLKTWISTLTSFS